MQLGLVGLGQMGEPMARRLVAAGHDVVGCDVAVEAVARARRAGVQAVGDLSALVRTLRTPRVVWLMVPAPATGQVINHLAGLLAAGDLVADGGNSDWRQASSRSARLAVEGVRFVDVGVSGGRWGWRHGYGITVGGARADVERLQPALTALAAPSALARVGQVGAGHFVKAVHNGVEYALLQAYAEGFALLSAHPDLDALSVLRVWQAGCSVRSFLLDQMVRALADNPTLQGIGSAVADSGMGRWTGEEAIRLGVAMPVLTAALQARFSSCDTVQSAQRLLVAAREQIGGHRANA